MGEQKNAVPQFEAVWRQWPRNWLGSRTALWTLGSFVLFLSITIALQWEAGAFQSELGGDPDAPAHYMTGLMVRDYVASFARTQPLLYAQNDYQHYPKIGLGHWPPGYYLLV
jgi:hypothetical protein